MNGNAQTKENDMKVYTIEQKMSGTGNIHDIASEHYDREIKFRRGTKFAVVLASYYGDHYSTHKTKDAAAEMSARQTRLGVSHKIIDTDGNEYISDGYTLRLND
jgi:hypothetical protein